MENQILQDFMVAYIGETVRLEMNGPAHQVAKSHGFLDRDFGSLIAAFPQVQRDFLNGAVTNPIDKTIQWPWPGKTGTEMIKAIHVPQQITKNNEGRLN